MRHDLDAGKGMAGGGGVDGGTVPGVSRVRSQLFLNAKCGDVDAQGDGRRYIILGYYCITILLS